MALEKLWFHSECGHIDLQAEGEGLCEAVVNRLRGSDYSLLGPCLTRTCNVSRVH